MTQVILDPKELQAKVKQKNASKPVLVPVEFIEEGTEVKGNIYIKPVSYENAAELEKAYTWKPKEDDPEYMELESIDLTRLKAAQLYATVCVDEKGTPFFKSVDEVLKSYPSMCRAFWEASNSINVFVGKLKTANSSETKSLQNLPCTESAETASTALNETSLSGNMPSGELTDSEGGV